MKLYNTLTERVEVFEPRGKEVKLYVCGITPYDTTHLGHAFTYAAVDVLVRYLELRGLQVNYVQNVTDVDDDILRKAKQEGEDWQLLGNRWTNHYIRDMQNLNILPPDRFPRATDVIKDIIDTTKKLIKSGNAYESGGSVYFSVASWPAFGILSHVPREEMLPIANERGNVPQDPNKRDPLDFVLWQAQAPDEPAWDSPWGPGRPGWHIECSTLSTKYLGDVVDIHGGGADLTFPHHECEIAQVEPLTKKPFVRHWFHTAMVSYDGNKMSKSLGNLVMVESLLRVHTPDALRVLLAQNHYRKPWSYHEDDLMKAERLVEKLVRAVKAQGGEGATLESEPYWAAFTADMDNDLDTPAALKVLEEMADEILDASLARRDLKEAQEALRTFALVFGLRLDQADAEARVVDEWTDFIRRET